MFIKFDRLTYSYDLMGKQLCEYPLYKGMPLLLAHISTYIEHRMELSNDEI